MLFRPEPCIFSRRAEIRPAALCGKRHLFRIAGIVGSLEQGGLRRCPAVGQRCLSGRCAHIQVGEGLVDHCRIVDAGDHFDGAAAGTAGLDVDIEYASSSKADVGAFIP